MKRRVGGLLMQSLNNDSVPLLQAFEMLVTVGIHLSILPGTFQTNTFDLKIDQWNSLHRSQLRQQELVENQQSEGFQNLFRKAAFQWDR